MVGPGWQRARKRMVRQLGVSVLAKTWIRFKFLRELKKRHLQRWRLPSSPLYQSLREENIRLLRLRPGLSVSTIEAEFVYVPLYDPGKYVALSYTWGQGLPSVPIWVNGRMMLVGENLYLALLHLRKRKTPLIWVDALCINQTDLQERASEVQRMRDIYQQAGLVVVWLGDSDNLSTQAFDAFHGMAEHVDWKEQVPEWAVDPHRCPEHPQWRAISDILYRPWFRRTWIIQEILVARQAIMMCGKDSLSMDVFFRIVNAMVFADTLHNIMMYHPNRHELSDGPMKVSVEQIEFLAKAKIKQTDPLSGLSFSPTFLNLLIETSRAEVTDPRDKIYGILGLAKENTAGPWEKMEKMWVSPRVDYTLSKEQVFTDAAEAIICSDRSLDILRLAGKHSMTNSTLPSWVPDWQQVVPISTTLESSARREEKSSSKPWCPIREKVTRLCSPFFSFRKDHALVVRGVHYDTITAVSEHVNPLTANVPIIPPIGASQEVQRDSLNAMKRRLDLLYDWVGDCVRRASGCSPYPTGESASDALWRTLYKDAVGESSSEPLPFDKLIDEMGEARSSLELAMEKLYSIDPKTIDPLIEMACEIVITRFEAVSSRLAKMQHCSSKRFATTRDRYMGLVPQQAQVGDLICVLHGCETPFVLRRKTPKAFELIGQCSIWGLKYDKAVSRTVTQLGWRRTRGHSKFSITTSSGERVYTILRPTKDFAVI